MSAAPQRIFLGKDNGLAHRTRVYRLPDALEVDVSDHYHLSRRRVFFDEVRLVTLHARSRRVAGAVIAVFAAFWLLLALVIPNGTGVDAFFFILAALFALAAAPYLLLPDWVVTAQGRRTRARLRFGLREARARAVYGEIARLAADAQRALAARYAKEAPPPAEEAYPEPPPGEGSATSEPPPG